MTAVLVAAAPAQAQVRPEFRSEFVPADDKRVEVGGGLTFRLSTYVRANATTTYEVWSSSYSATAQWRGEGSVRFLLDPLAERRWGLSIGAGAGYREQAYLLAIIDVEGPVVSFVRPALSLSLGGGVRAALVFRGRTSHDRR